MAIKFFIVIFALWLSNILFVSIHEMGHGIMTAAFGGKICNIYVNPLGLDGSITHTVIPDALGANIVLSAGLGITTLALMVFYYLKLDLFVYVMAIRTIECAINLNPGSDMYTLMNSIGSNAFVIMALIVVINAYFAGQAFYNRCNTIERDIFDDRAKDMVKPALFLSIFLTPLISIKR
ncbi:hypothetical protein CUJ83_01155 [Methanocella sp. CWC-04]|uniref:Uncharacterized protein n=1 Tax=Methanooceanicella nereidis TaxID=2052831 RepID=A0AAP2RCL6_9EURY|nr:hypothetical protein [Methanocella sp. CWC-04]MCD1293605.1 hypothetical protein [Methanocella sp. CWC-04]